MEEVKSRRFRHELFVGECGNMDLDGELLDESLRDPNVAEVEGGTGCVRTIWKENWSVQLKFGLVQP